MKQNKKAILELIGYGFFFGIFSLAFFFGLLYPEYGLARGSYHILEEELSVEDDRMLWQTVPREKVIYRSYFLKCLDSME